MSAQGASIVPSVTLRIADPDGSIYTNYEANAARGFEGAAVELELVFWEQGTANFSSDSAVKMRGIANGPTITDDALSIVVDNRLNLQKLLLPSVRIGRRCPLAFPTTVAQREAAANDQARGSSCAATRRTVSSTCCASRPSASRIRVFSVSRLAR